MVERAAFGVALMVQKGLLQRQSDPVHHGVKKVGLAGEMPVDGTPGCASVSGYVAQRGARDALCLKQYFSCIKQARAGGAGVFFGSTSQSGLSWGFEVDLKYTFTNVRKILFQWKSYYWYFPATQA